MVFTATAAATLEKPVAPTMALVEPGLKPYQAEPEEEDAEDVQGGAVPGHGNGVARGIEAAEAWAQHPSPRQAGKAAHHVHGCHRQSRRRQSWPAASQEVLEVAGERRAEAQPKGTRPSARRLGRQT